MTARRAEFRRLGEVNDQMNIIFYYLYTVCHY